MRNFIRINEELEIDNSYITCAEYQLFLDETRERPQFLNLFSKKKTDRFPPGDAKKPITGISWENALRFCAWLGQWYRTRLGNQLSEMAVHYRLPKEEEINQYFINDDQRFKDGGIRLVKFQIPSRYSGLADGLWNGRWESANQKTIELMYEVVGKKPQGDDLNLQDIENFPCDDLRIIDNLWVYASKGHFGFSVQKRIWESEGQDIKKFMLSVEWKKNGWFGLDSLKIVYGTKAPRGHLPYHQVSEVLYREDADGFSTSGQAVYGTQGGFQSQDLFSRIAACEL
ncbi:MAG: GUN4 domain-containing protein [Tolypothrix sp. Co-bin9]|nr:GUN4 domain-containing protein [Tolypothrix sp. Co-bin9]